MSKSWTRARPYMVLAAACTFGACSGGATFGQDGPGVPERAAAGPAKDHSFRASVSWSGPFPPAGALDDDPPFLLADVDGDRRKDLVHFGKAGVTVGFSTGTGFTQTFVLADFGAQQGWNQIKHVRTMGDVNRDGRDDIVGFGSDGTYVSLSTGTGFTTPVRAVANFGHDQGWRPQFHTRILADVDNDGRKDIVAFGDAGVWLSLSTVTGFSIPRFVIAEFGRQQGWNPFAHVRTTADVNGDGRADVVAIGRDGVWIALSAGAGFGAAQFVLADFGTQSGWTGQRHVRQLVDVDADGKADVVGFGNEAVWMARSTGSGFEPVKRASPHFGNSWLVSSKARTAVDLNDDVYPDLLFVGDDAIFRILGGPNGFGNPRMVLRDLVLDNGIDTFLMVRRLIGDVDGDGLADLVGFVSRSLHKEIRVALSSNAPPPPPPANPTGARVVAKTNRAVKIAWNDNSTDELAFIVHHGKAGNRTLPDVGLANVANRVIAKLDPDSDYCFTLQAASVFGLSAQSTRVCTRTDAGNTSRPPLDTGITFVCGAPGPCPAGFHAVGFMNLPQCPGEALAANRTICAANVGTFTSCGGCPPGFSAIGGRHFEATCRLPISTPFGNAALCAQVVIGP